jgi:hypothetical protein
MVDVTSGNIVSSYKYDPLGSAAVTGSGYKTGYQFHGLENDTWAYYAGDSYYTRSWGGRWRGRGS